MPVEQGTPEQAEGKRRGEVYIGTKLIRAYPMTKHEHERDMRIVVSESRRSNQEGYRVIYEDGYKSWSPKATFDLAYRQVTTMERALF